MAYYDVGYMWAQEHTTFFPLAHQDPVSFSGCEPYGHVDPNYDACNVSMFHEPNCIDLGDSGYEFEYNTDYDNNYDYGDCHNWYSSANASYNYFAHNYMEPKLIAHGPVECDTGYVSYHHTQYTISYSKVHRGFNEPEFEEYDPTPYDGGYDITSTYGKPLPPSDLTCYPRSKPKPIEPRPTPNSEAEPQTKASPKPEPMPLVEPEPKPKPKPKPEPVPEPVHALVPVPEPLGLKEVGEREREEYGYPGYGYDYPWPEYDNAQVGYDYGYGRQVVQIPPCEYSPEVVDLFESIFGSWPWLARSRKQQMGIC